jgi:Uncharacterised methyltransferase family (DUF6094)
MGEQLQSLPESEARNIRSVLRFPFRASVIDPCVGAGTTLELVTAGADVNRYGVDLDAGRAKLARAAVIRVIQGNTFDAHAKLKSFSLRT